MYICTHICVHMCTYTYVCTYIPRSRVHRIAQEMLDEALFLCSTTEGRLRKRLLGGGRRKLIPKRMAMLVYARLTYLTWINGKFSNSHLIQAIKDFSRFVITHHCLIARTLTVLFRSVISRILLLWNLVPMFQLAHLRGLKL